MSLDALTAMHLWTPEQFKQMKTPRLTLAHVGPLAPQSEHRRFSSSFSSAVKTRLCSSFCALLTLFLLLLDMMAGRGGALISREPGLRAAGVKVDSCGQ